MGAMRSMATAVDLIVDTVPSQFPAFYMAIGRAITKWQDVEKALCSIFKIVSTCRDEEVASAIFYAERDFSTKLELAKCAARISLGKDDLDKFLALRKRMITASEYRNALAHFQLSLTMTLGEKIRVEARFISDQGELMSVPEESDSSATPFLLLHSNSTDPNERFKSSKDRQQTKKPMGISQVVGLHQTFVQLSNDLKKFAMNISHTQEQVAE